MKKVTAILIASAFVVSVGFTSCKKCSTCVAKDKTTGTQLATSGEFCGSKDEVKETEDAFKTTWGTVADVTCE